MNAKQYLYVEVEQTDVAVFGKNQNKGVEEYVGMT